MALLAILLAAGCPERPPLGPDGEQVRLDARIDAGPRCSTSGLVVQGGGGNYYGGYTKPIIVSDNNGGVLLVHNLIRYESLDFQSTKDEMCMARLFGPDGRERTGAAGLRLSQKGYRGVGVSLSPNTEDRWMVTWNELTYEGKYTYTFGQVIDPAGKLLWSPPFTMESNMCLSRIPDGSGGFVLVCGAGLLYIMRVDKDGKQLWPKLVTTGTGYFSGSVNHGDGKGGIVYYYWEYVEYDKNHYNRAITIQHLDGNGKPLYSQYGRPITGKDRRYYAGTGLVKVHGSSEDLALVVMEGVDGQLFNPAYDKEPIKLYATRVDLDGNITWRSRKPVLLADTKTYKLPMLVIGDGQGGLLTTWSEDRDNDGKKECYAQRVLADGSLVWPLGGRRMQGDGWALCRSYGGTVGGSAHYTAIRLGTDGFALAYWLKTEGDTSSISKVLGLAVQRYTWDLTPRWSKPVILASCDKPYFQFAIPEPNGVVTDKAGGLWVAWSMGPEKWSSDAYGHYYGLHIRLQRISGDGKPYFVSSTSDQ